MWNRNNEESAVTRRDVEMFKSLKNNTSYNYTVLKKNSHILEIISKETQTQINLIFQ